MKDVLLVLSSAASEKSYSRKFANQIVDDLSKGHEAVVKVRDLAKSPLPHVGEAFAGGIYRPAEQRTPEQAQAVALSDAVVDELLAADIVVIAAPMYNFGVPSTLKAWIDHVARAGRTFSYSEQGPKGLVTGKKVILVLARGGIYSEGPMRAFDFQETYLRAVLGFLGMTDVQVVRVEGVAMGEAALRRAVESANAQLDTLQKLAA